MSKKAPLAGPASILTFVTLFYFLPLAFAVNPPSVQYGPYNFVNYETPHVHPIEKTADGKSLLAVNTAEGSLMVFTLSGASPKLATTLMVGIDPVTVRARNASEAWVVNRVSNSINIVDLNANVVTSVFDVCHAPGDVVFAGSPVRAVVSCTKPNKLVMIDPVTHALVSSVNILGESPRSLAVSADGSTVYAAIFESGTPTTILVGDTNDVRINNVTQYAGGPWGGLSPVPNNGKVFNPPFNPALPPPPPVSTIVYKTGDGNFTNSASCSTAVFGSPIAASQRSCWMQDPVSLTWSVCAQEGGTCTFSGQRLVIFGAAGYTSSGRWRDDINGDWTSIVTGNLSAVSNRVAKWDLVDRDVAILNVGTAKVSYQTRLMNAVMAISVNPANGQVYAVGTDATNYMRYQPVIAGRFLRVNLARFTPGQAPTIIDLNPHLTYAAASVSAALRSQSIGDPRAISWTSDGKRGYISGMGSNTVVAIDASGTRLASVKVGQGPTGIAVDDSRGQVYVLNKFDATISVLRISDSSLISTIAFFDPTPASITAGRPFFYNTQTTSGNGQIACASCHIDGKTDRLAWDLGDPSGDFTERNTYGFHPMKGPFVTQTLQNIIGAPSMHHRGDRADIFTFADAFHDLQGADAPLDTPSMTRLQSFLSSLAFPPNPNRNPDNSLSTLVPLPGPAGTVRGYADAANGKMQFEQANSCTTCHLGSMGRGDTQGQNVLHLSQPASPETMQGFYERLGMFWQSIDGSTTGTGIRPNGAHDSMLANESTSNEHLAYMLSFEGPQDGRVERSANSHAGVGLQLTLTPAGATQQNGTFCANQNASCTFTGTREVIFGANGTWVSGIFTGSAACNTATFGDPAPGVAKTCALRATPLARCAAQNGSCAFDQLSEVFYSSGSGPAYSKVLRVNAPCTDSFFGDPAYGKTKSCYVRPASEFARLNYMLNMAISGKVGMVFSGFAYGVNRGGYYIGNGWFQTDIANNLATTGDLYAALQDGAQLQLMLVPRGTEYRIGVDANLDGRLNADQLQANTDPRVPSAGVWKSCAAEGQNCAFSGSKAVRFGSPSQYLYGVFYNGAVCSQAVFGVPAAKQTNTCSTAN